MSKDSDKVKFNFDAQYFEDKVRPVFSQNNNVSVLNWQLPVRKFGEVAVFSPNTLHRAINSNASFLAAFLMSQFPPVQAPRAAIFSNNTMPITHFSIKTGHYIS